MLAYNNIDWMQQVQDSYQRWALLIVVMNLQIP